MAAAEVYGLNVLVPEIEDRPTTPRASWSSAASRSSPAGEDKTTLLVSAAHTDAPGALFRLLEPLAQHGISMTRIESRPSRKRKWDYVFFIDVEGHAERRAAGHGARELKSRARCSACSARIREGDPLTMRPTSSRRCWRRRRHHASRATSPSRTARSCSARWRPARTAGHRLPRRRGLPLDHEGGGAARRDRRATRARRGAGRGRRPARLSAPARARHGQCRHGDAAVHGAAQRAAVRFGAGRRRLADAPSDGACRQAAARDGRADRDHATGARRCASAAGRRCTASTTRCRWPVRR
jgi:hypothetical protein